MKKTLIITLEFPPQVGGIATYVDAFARTVPAEQIVVLAPPHPDAATFDATLPYTVIRASFYFPKLIWPRWLRLYLHVRKIVAVHAIEQIHVHHLLPVGYVARLMRKTCSYIIFSHGTDLVRVQGKRWKQYWAKKILVYATRVVVNSTSLEQRFAATFPLVQDRMSIVYPCPSGIFQQIPDSTTLDTLRSSLALDGKQILLTVSRFDEGKGIPQLVRAVAALLPAHPNLVWVLIGDGKKKNQVIELIQKYQLQNVVRYLGTLPHAALPPYYYLADVFVLLTHPDSTRKDEGFGMVFLEAAAVGLPVVAGQSGGTVEAVIHNETGLIVNTYNQEEVTAAISTLLRQPELRVRLAQTAKARVETTFTWEYQIRTLDPWL